VNDAIGITKTSALSGTIGFPLSPEAWRMFKILGFGDVTWLEAWTISLAAVALSMIVGWVIDVVTDEVGFGVFGNTFICLVAIAVALVSYGAHIGELSVSALPLIMGAATASVVVHMFILIYLRRTFKL
jgi:hypothetical protein